MKFFRKIVIGVSTIAFTALALTSTTYAWFKINSRASVTGINFKLTGGLGFYVSVDGVNYSNDLTSDDIYMAMIAKYAPERFIIHYDESIGKGILYTTKKVEEKDQNGETIMIDDGNGNQVPKLVTTYDEPANDSEIAQALRNIELMPVTTTNGVDMKDLFEATATATSGRYVEFDVYFRTVSQTGYRRATKYDPDAEYYDSNHIGVNKENVNENNYFNYYVYNGANINYDIYLNGDNDWIDPATGRATSVSPTSFKSEGQPVALSADMYAYQNGVATTITKGNAITVHGANALRLSITDNKVYDETGGVSGAVVYELNDKDNDSKNLGSYALNDYTQETCAEIGKTFTDQDAWLYDYTHNASYTYYSNLKGASDLEHSTLYSKMYSYKDIPSKCVKYSDLLRDGDGNYPNNKVITTLSSDASNPTLLTFRIWLEGWDADCFDGISGNIQSLLSFVAVAN